MTDSLRILHVVTVITPDNAYGGPVTVARVLVEELRRQGRAARLLAGRVGTPQAVRSNEITVPVRRVIPVGRFSGLFSLRMAITSFREISRCDVVHIHFARDIVTYWSAVTALVLRKPLILQLHGMVARHRAVLAGLLDAIVTRPILRAAHTVFALTEQEADRIVEFEPRARVSILPNGISPSKARASYEPEPKTLFLARLHPRKRVEDFLGLARMAGAERSSGNFIVAGPDAGQRPLVEAATANSGVNITYLGAVEPSQVLGLLHKVQIFVLPSVREPFPMTVLEALSVGVPVVIRADCGLAPLVARYGAGTVFAGGPEELYSAWSTLALDKDRWEEASRAGIELITNELSVESIGALLIPVYERAGQTTRG